MQASIPTLAQAPRRLGQDHPARLAIPDCFYISASPSLARAFGFMSFYFTASRWLPQLQPHIHIPSGEMKAKRRKIRWYHITKAKDFQKFRADFPHNHEPCHPATPSCKGHRKEECFSWIRYLPEQNWASNNQEKAANSCQTGKEQCLPHTRAIGCDFQGHLVSGLMSHKRDRVGEAC